MIICILLLSVGFSASQHIINENEFPKTQQLIMNLAGLIQESTALKTCINTIASPLDKVIGFGNDVREIDTMVEKIEARIESTVTIMQAIMLIPYVGQVSAVVLGPAVTVLNMIQSGLHKVDSVISHFAGLVDQWTRPLQKIRSEISMVTGKIDKFNSIVQIADAKATAAEACVDELPVGRSDAIHALEGVSHTLNVIPSGLDHLLSHVNGGCSKVEHFLSRIHLVRRRRGLPSLKVVKHVLEAILKAFGPLGHFLDKVDHVLHKKFCIIDSLIKIVDGVLYIGKEAIKGVEHLGKEIFIGAEHVGKEIIKGAEHLGKEVIHGAEHLAHEVGHVWVEVEDKTKHVIHEVGHVGKEVVKGMEHVGEEVFKGAEHVGKEVVKGAEHVGKEVVKGAEHVGKEVVKGAEHVGKEVVKGAEHVGKEVVKGAEHVIHEVAHITHSITHSISHAFHHLFGRRSVPEAIYYIDGHFYILVNRHFETRHQRGLDICVSLSDILKGVNFITGGLMSKATDLIQKLFHGKMPFHIPGLTSDVLNIGSLFRSLDFGITISNIGDILKLPELEIEKILHLDLNLFEKYLPGCKEALWPCVLYLASSDDAVAGEGKSFTPRCNFRFNQRRADFQENSPTSRSQKSYKKCNIIIQ